MPINFLFQLLSFLFDLELFGFLWLLLKLSAQTKYVDRLSSSCLQIAPIYLSSCMKQGMGLLEILLSKLPAEHNEMLLKVMNC